MKPTSGDSGCPPRLNFETLPAWLPLPSVGRTPPHPKLPDHMLPDGSKPRPKPCPKTPPPNTGETGVPWPPSAGWPVALRTIMQSVEPGVPCTTLLVIQTPPSVSNTKLPGPPNGQSSWPFESTRPVALNFTAKVKASRRMNSSGASGPCCAVKFGSNTLVRFPDANNGFTFAAGLRAMSRMASHVVVGRAPPGGVVSENSVPQASPEFRTQSARMLAR